MAKTYICECCGKKSGSGKLCGNCREKIKLLRQIREMLMPYKKGKENGNKR